MGGCDEWWEQTMSGLQALPIPRQGKRSGTLDAAVFHPKQARHPKDQFRARWTRRESELRAGGDKRDNVHRHTGSRETRIG